MSPSHQQSHALSTWPLDSKSLKYSDNVPLVALNNIEPDAIRMKVTTFWPRPKIFWEPIVRFSMSAPKIGAREFPEAIPSAVENVSSPVVKLIKSEPRKMPGQHEDPHAKVAASAIPAGGQNKVMLEFTRGMLSPSFPARKYAAASTITRIMENLGELGKHNFILDLTTGQE